MERILPSLGYYYFFSDWFLAKLILLFWRTLYIYSIVYIYSFLNPQLTNSQIFPKKTVSAWWGLKKSSLIHTFIHSQIILLLPLSHFFKLNYTIQFQRGIGVSTLRAKLVCVWVRFKKEHLKLTYILIKDVFFKC